LKLGTLRFSGENNPELPGKKQRPFHPGCYETLVIHTD
jgi:hypothetical protein